jgi:1-phosphatidylinositol-4-phosphate 5-kinase
LTPFVDEGAPLPVSTPPPPFQEATQDRSVPTQYGHNLMQKGAVTTTGSSSRTSETVSISEVFVETRRDYRSNLSVASSSTTSGVSSGHHRMHRSPPAGVHEINRNTSGTPTWTEGTPSFTESSSSGDLGENYKDSFH